MSMKEWLEKKAEERRVKEEADRNVNRKIMWEAKRNLVKHNRFDMVPIIFPRVVSA